MEDVKFECWVDVPGTDGRYQVSNLGHLRMMARKKRICGRMAVVVSVEGRRLVCDYKTGRLGWWVFFDNGKLFLPRDELIALFPVEMRNVDSSLDEEAKALRDETYLDPEALRESAKARKEARDQ